uniref:Uncharacterized protein n=1 Tax=Rhizophora mucronata TaxID=61149 RepID=A0A2P2QWF7_RHIMU
MIAFLYLYKRQYQDSTSKSKLPFGPINNLLDHRQGLCNFTSLAKRFKISSIIFINGIIISSSTLNFLLLIITAISIFAT